MSTEYLYRYESHSIITGYDRSSVEVYVRAYEIVKRTPQGAWITYSTHHPKPDKFVLLTAKKKFACATEEEALRSFIFRKRRQTEILKSDLEFARQSLEAALDKEYKRIGGQ